MSFYKKNVETLKKYELLQKINVDLSILSNFSRRVCEDTPIDLYLNSKSFPPPFHSHFITTLYFLVGMKSLMPCEDIQSSPTLLGNKPSPLHHIPHCSPFIFLVRIESSMREPRQVLLLSCHYLPFLATSTPFHNHRST
jgi:hypothetical protein